MNNVDWLGPWLRRFLTEHIVSERNLAINTRKSYRDTFSLLLPFVSAGVHKPVDRLAVSDLTSTRVRQFLAHLEERRGCSVQTRNQRLTALPLVCGLCGRSRADVGGMVLHHRFPPPPPSPDPILSEMGSGRS